ncbi:hypothetical protein FH972_024021 [Carpinus fangiana]|uniref:Uncharacterized protein n=1 Tax=Carpinus fangiana TaxID=176857 RepID=A0A5N6KXI4_9ROSI|nr:hypothetical protein FH972_024021 [Carpinus fangiana]
MDALHSTIPALSSRHSAGYRLPCTGLVSHGPLPITRKFAFLHPSKTRTLTTEPKRAIVTAGWQKTQAAATGHNADGFRDFVKDDDVSFTTHDIHHSYTPLCKDRKSLLAAMSGGGRIGWDEPYQTRGCDMQWFTNAEVCKILSRFDHVYFLGDSLMRHTVMAMMVLLRGDLVSGARATWRHDDPTLNDCTGHRLFHDKRCIWMSAIGSPAVLTGDPDSIKCPKHTPPALVTWNPTLAFPLMGDTFDYMPDLSKRMRPDGRIAFVLSHGLWNDLDFPMSMSWFEQIQDNIARYMPTYASPKLSQRLFPRLFISPTAQGELKPDMVVPTQNNLRLIKETSEMRKYVQARGFDHLGLYNLTVQATSPDGTHATMENNLMKAMMVLNWLNMLDPPEAEEWEREERREQHLRLGKGTVHDDDPNRGGTIPTEWAQESSPKGNDQLGGVAGGDRGVTAKMARWGKSKDGRGGKSRAKAKQDGQP